MKLIMLALLCVIAVAVVIATALRVHDWRANRREADRLIATQPRNPAVFSMDMVSGLPEPAQRYFAFAIAEGTPLRTVARIEMEGQFSLGSRDAPNYMGMQARQVLAAPEGFVWEMTGGSGPLIISGSDSGQWTRFWMAGLIPVARAGGDRDHERSAFGRYVAEAAFWTPAALLPGEGVQWSAIGPDTVRYTMTRNGTEQAVDLTVDDIGRPTEVQFQRWSNANAEGVYRLQPFGGILSEFREIDGFQVPTHVEAGNFFGTEAYFPFFIVDVTEIRFPQ